MSIGDLDTPMPTNILQQNSQRILSLKSTISASTAGTTTTDRNGGDNELLDGHEGKTSLTKPIYNSTYSTLNPTMIFLPENCAFASPKDNAYFHALFKSVPEHDRLLEVYKCALHRDILLQGHLYLSENFACFHANIFGWITNLVIEYNEVTLIERKMTAMIIPNGIQINTQHAKHTFASFIFRETAYQQLTSLWTMHQPQQQPQSALTLADEWTMDLDDTDNDTESTDDEDTAACLDLLGQRQDNTNRSLLATTSPSPTWKIMLLALLLLNSLWMIRKWIQLDNRLKYHQSRFEPPGLSSSSSYFDHHPIYTKLGQLRQRMESLNQQIVNQKLHIYDLSPSSTKLDSLN